MTDISAIRSNMQALDSSERKQLAIEAAGGLGYEDRQEISRTLSGPSQGMTDKIWMIVVIGFVIVFVGAFLTMAYYYANKDINLDKMLTVFTTVSAFLAGLLAPSPIRNK